MGMRKMKFMVLAAVMFFSGAMIATAADQAMTPLDIPTLQGVEALKPGADAPDFDVKDTAGKPFHFSGKDSKGSLLVFWSLFCEPCREEMPLIQSLFDRYKDKGLRVLSVALDGDDMGKSITQFAKEKGYTFTLLLDKENEDGSLVVSDAYFIPGTPTLYIVSPEGKIVFSRVGRVGEEELEKAITETLGK
ncbi:TlpA family protein disulfide reductase [bacterium]|nr:MAG: TlpA family protein disulfide reductase [bacterium]